MVLEATGLIKSVITMVVREERLEKIRRISKERIKMMVDVTEEVARDEILYEEP